MKRRPLLIFLMAFWLIGCDQQVQSQSTFRPEANAAPGVQDSIGFGRTTAITRAVQIATPAVVSVNVTQTQRIQVNPYQDPFYDFFFGRQRAKVMDRDVQSMGSGFVISSDGYIVTNDHVAGEASQITIAFPDGTTLPATLIGSDAGTDLALLKVESELPLAHLAFELSSPPLVGEWSIALGNPFGLFEASDPTVTVGVVSATGRDLQPQDNRFYMDMIQTDAAINRGNSGGPLLNALGNVIGVNTAIFTESGGSVGIGFAVPAEKAVRVLEEIRDKGFVDRSYYTGLRGRTLPQRWAQALGLSEARGFVVEEVDPGSPADVAGFKPYDVIRALEGEDVDDQNELLGYLFDYRPGDTISLEIVREGKEVPVTMTLGSQ
ncbi:MAG: PDZ domain-containing protein [Bacteroidetes Order II. Incertae sedis bacterium]|jgi:serine protease Do|nr:PDZ domain-containing protein [Bacteroidetes Order II. bacterium]MDG1755413.1 trypsin-like peptidase domain-containing protein [Rhodothermales bacterium]HAY36925.1 2-alkenal reductase [Bacteroidota bacterium]MBT4052383.1 PDZ domain-containing protein [Bacteroidetes Order II. bacterium]MBT5249933.1 PDZ domain-containing protein [Bacteroidetes Order II. bacterium]